MNRKIRVVIAIALLLFAMLAVLLLTLSLGSLLEFWQQLETLPVWVKAIYAGLVLLCLGNGLFKPNISAMVGNLYEPGDPRRDAGFNIFYMGINIGAFAAAFLAASVRNELGWLATFWVAGAGLVISVIILLANTISVLTSISLSAIATNLRVKGGGDYYLISRTLGV